VLSTIDSLAESLSLSSNCVDALRWYDVILERSVGVHRAEAVVFYKMSKVHSIQNDVDAMLSKLQLALRAVRSMNGGEAEKQLDEQINVDISKCRVELQKRKLEWV
jgi:hypothetical protein